MSHPLFNFVSGKQRPYGLSIGQTEKDSLKALPHIGSSLGSSGATPVAPVKSGVIKPARFIPPLRYRAGMKEAMLDKDIESVLDLNIGDTREDEGHQTIHFTSDLRDEFPLVNSRVMTHQACSASRGPSDSDHSLDWLQICKKAPIRDSSLDWLQICKKATNNNIYPGLYSSFTHLSGGRRLETSSGVENTMQLSTVSLESGCSKYSLELDETLERFGLDKHDLDPLLTYSDDQITAESLPLILQQIRIQKGKMSAVQSEALANPPPAARVSVMDRLGSFDGAEMFQDRIPSAGLRPSQVYSGPSEDGPDGAVDGEDNWVERRSVSMINSSSHIRESRTLQVKISGLGSAASLSSNSSVVPPTCDPTKPLQTQTDQDSLTGLTSSSLPKPDQNTELLKSEVSKNLTLKEPEISETQTSRTLLHGSGPSRPEPTSNNTEVKHQASETSQPIKTQTLKQQASKIVFPPQVKPGEPPSVPGTITGPPAAPQPTQTPGDSPDTAQHSNRLQSTVNVSSRIIELPPSSSTKSPDQEDVSKRVPPPYMMEDCLGVTPRRFPHTCRLCNDIFLHMRGWLSHINNNHHLNNRKLLLKRYPEWDAAALPVKSGGCQNSHHNSCSRSPSPRRYHSVRGQRSRSRSPRYERRPARHRSRSRSRERRSSYRRRDEKPSSPRRSREKQSGRPKQRRSSSAEKQPEKTAVKSQSDQETEGNIRSPSSSATSRGSRSEGRQKSDPGSSGTLQNPASSKDRMEPEPQKVSESTSSESKQTAEISDKLKAETLTVPASTPHSVSGVSTDRLVSAERKQTCEENRKTSDQRTYSSDPVTSLTVGEMIEIHLQRRNLKCSNLNTIHSTKLKTLLLIDNLPVYQDGCYTEADIANLLRPFGFQYVESNIYVIPKLRMAFVAMQSVKELKAFIMKNLFLTFKGSELILEIVHNKMVTTPFQFYKSLMKLMDFDVTDDGSSVVYIQNISPSEARDLRETLRKMGSIRNYLPLLNKVFIEFDSVYDADRLGVWYSLLNKGLDHKVYRMKLPRSSATSPPPRRGSDVLPGIKDDVAKTTTLTNIQRIPQGSLPPFWVTMTTAPYMFPTASPWFITPDFMTVNQVSDIAEAQPRACEFSTIMLTGLPGGFYSHEDVVNLVSCCFPQDKRQSLNFNLIVLTMQKRAFVYFNNWEACQQFVVNYLTNPVSIRGYASCPSIHFVLQDLHPGLSEETVYSNLMKWSNSHIPVLETLEGRLLRVETYKTNVVRVMKAVASIAPFTNYLVLADKIYIEMAERNDAEKVENLSLKGRLCGQETWKSMLRVKSLTSSKPLHLSSKPDVVLDKKPQSTSSGSNDSVTEQSVVTLKETSDSIITPLDSNMTHSSDQVLKTSECQKLQREDVKTAKDPLTPEQEIPSNQTWSLETRGQLKGQKHIEDGEINQILDGPMDGPTRRSQLKTREENSNEQEQTVRKYETRKTGKEMKDGHDAAKNQTSDSLQIVNKMDKQTKEEDKATLRSAKRQHEDETGEEFLERKLGFFCSLCSIFYLNKSKMEDEHCCSRAHYDNLKKYYQKLQQGPSRKSTRNPVRR